MYIIVNSNYPVAFLSHFTNKILYISLGIWRDKNMHDKLLLWSVQSASLWAYSMLLWKHVRGICIHFSVNQFAGMHLLTTTVPLRVIGCTRMRNYKYHRIANYPEDKERKFQTSGLTAYLRTEIERVNSLQSKTCSI